MSICARLLKTQKDLRELSFGTYIRFVRLSRWAKILKKQNFTKITIQARDTGYLFKK